MFVNLYDKSTLNKVEYKIGKKLFSIKCGLMNLLIVSCCMSSM